MTIGKEINRFNFLMPELFLITLFTWILLLTAQTSCFASTVVIQWDPNTDADLSGYKVYYQADSSSIPYQGTGAAEGAAPIDVSNQTTATISGLDPAHAYYFAVTAYNTSGVESAYSNIVSVPELVSPEVSLTSPTDNETISGTISVDATASDNVGVTSVEFYANGHLLAATNVAPYSYIWDTELFVNGMYALSAKAYDAAGNVGQTGNVNVNVSNGLSVTLGDINNDSKVDIADALMALKFAVDLIQASPDQLSRGDVCPIVNGISAPDGVFDIQDALVILKVSVGLTYL